MVYYGKLLCCIISYRKHQVSLFPTQKPVHKNLALLSKSHAQGTLLLQSPRQKLRTSHCLSVTSQEMSTNCQPNILLPETKHSFFQLVRSLNTNSTLLIKILSFRLLLVNVRSTIFKNMYLKARHFSTCLQSQLQEGREAGGFL